MSATTVERTQLALIGLARSLPVVGASRIGIDAVDIDAFTRTLAVGGVRVVDRFFTAAERAHAGDDRDTLAATLAGKEAVAKVLGTGIRGTVGWRTIEIPRHGHGEPFVRLSAGAADRAHAIGVGEIAISLCHEGPLALAIACGSPDRGA